MFICRSLTTSDMVSLTYIKKALPTLSGLNQTYTTQRKSIKSFL